MDPSRRLSYRKRKKLGLTLSEAFLEEAVPPKARSVDRGYASVMSPASVGQGDEQSEWDERQARIDQPDGLSRLMSDMDRAKEDDESSEEIFVGEPGMKVAMLNGFFDELTKLGAFDEPETAGEILLYSFLDELEKNGALSEEALEKLAVVRARMRKRFKSGSGSRKSYQTGRARGMKRSQAVEKQRMASAAPEAAKLQKAYLESPAPKPTPAADPGKKAPAPAPADPGKQPAPPTKEKPAPTPDKAAPPPQPVPEPAAAPQGWLGQQWGALTNPITQGWQQGGLGGALGGAWQGMNAAPLLGYPAAGLAGMAMLPPALRAVGLGQERQSPGAVPGMVNMPG